MTNFWPWENFKDRLADTILCIHCIWIELVQPLMSRICEAPTGGKDGLG